MKQIEIALPRFLVSNSRLKCNKGAHYIRSAQIWFTIMITRKNGFFLGRRQTALEHLFKAAFLNAKAGMNGGAAELAMIRHHLMPGSTVIDVGANVGNFTRRFATLVPDGMVLAFEPQSLPRAILTVAGTFRKRRNILVFPFALSDEPGLLELSIPIKSRGIVGIGLAHTGDDHDLADRFDVKKELVAATTLDRVLEHVETGPVSMIKIDVEGAELKVLRGAVSTIGTHRPAILCEIDGREGRFGETLSGLLDFMKAHNYLPTRIRDGSLLEFDELETNVLFQPGERMKAD